MDDLDHSIHISEFDWSSFYDESEECDLLQASLAYSDDFNLSDSEILENCPQKIQLCPDAESITEEEICNKTAKPTQKPDQSDIRGPVNNIATSVKEEKMCVSYSTATTKTELVKESTQTSHSVTKTLQTDLQNVQYSEETKDCSLQTESGLQPTKEPDLLSCYKLGMSVDESDIGEKAGGGKKAEKERWFVTVNNNPPRQQRHPTLKKKRKIKNISERGPKTNLRQESLAENRSKKNRKIHKSEGGKLGLSKKIERSGERFYEHIQDVPDFSGSLETPVFIEKNIPKDVLIGHEWESDRSASPSLNTSASLQADDVQKDKPEDGPELFSNLTYDSDPYLSATESTEEPQCPLPTHLIKHPQSLLPPLYDSLSENTNQAKNTQMYLKENALCSDLAAPNGEDYESSSTEPSVTFSSANQSASETPADDSTCTHDSPVDTSGALTHSVNVSDPTTSEEDHSALLHVPKLTVIPCSVGDSPETYAIAAGHSKPIYAISAFWDEMEKLTINDILHLKMGRISPPTQIQKPDTNQKHSSRVGTVEFDLADGSQVDTSDTADSDYFTQTDEFKPDRSSCDFSNSDWEEEYMQFLSTSKNSDQLGDNQLGSSIYSHMDDSTNSEERETPVPSEVVTPEFFDSHTVQMLTSQPRMLAKSSTTYNVQALSTEDFSLLPVLSHDDNSLAISRTLSLEEDINLKEISDLETLLPPSLSSYTNLLDADYQMPLSEMFESCLTEENTTSESQCLAIYDPQDVSVALIFDHDLCALMHASSSSHLYSPEKPIPIFSCSRPTVRELTFPKQHFILSANGQELDKISPIKLISHSFGQKDLRCSAIEMGSERFLSFRKIRFHDKGSIWCEESGAWVFPVRDEEIPISGKNQTVLLPNKRRTSIVSSQGYGELTENQRIPETVWIKRENLFSSVKQSDMCLVCIAFASWVLKSSDPNAADAWKAALLANVSALSAIQYLRQYVKKKNPSNNL